MKTDSPGHTSKISCLIILLLVLLIIPLFPAGCESGEPPPDETTIRLDLSSTAFDDGGSIPEKYTCDGEDISPPLAWNEPPPGTQSFALIMEDLDSPAVFTHWVVFNISPEIRELPEFLSIQSTLDRYVPHGKNSFGENGYGGPCPPSGKAHRYRFTLYALDSFMDLPVGVSKKPLLEAIEGYILARGELTGTYQR